MHAKRYDASTDVNCCGCSEYKCIWMDYCLHLAAVVELLATCVPVCDREFACYDVKVYASGPSVHRLVCPGLQA